MSELLPYEDQLLQNWTDIPLPDEDAAWEDMRKRLEDEGDDRPFIFWWKPGCAWWGLLVAILIIGWWIAGKQKEYDPVTGKVTSEKSDKKVNREQQSILQKDHPAINSIPRRKSDPGIVLRRKTTGTFITPGYNSPFSTGKEPDVTAVTDAKEEKVAGTKPRTMPGKVPGTISGTLPGTASETIPESVPPASESTISLSTPDSILPQLKTIKKDSTIPLPVLKPKQADSSNRSQFFLSTGIGLTQQVPVAGQKMTPYSATGRKGSLADYIPSVYLRVHKNEKWFLQAEFRYGASQYSKELLYQQVSIKDTGRNSMYTTNTSAKLKKTFYHQLPVTFQYQLKPDWWVGGGLVWNKFYAAVSDMESIRQNTNTQAETVVFKGLVSTKKDSSGNFASSYFQATLESQYKWKRFTIGARYSFGLQPYLRFSLPGLGEKSERNSSLQTFIRFEVWRARKGKKLPR